MNYFGALKGFRVPSPGEFLLIRYNLVRSVTTAYKNQSKTDLYRADIYGPQSGAFRISFKRTLWFAKSRTDDSVV
jgi:hypothetical protein